MQIKKIVNLSILLALSIVFNLLESLIPNFLIPGVKFGFANIIIIIAIFLFNPIEALLLTILRVFIVSFLKGDFLQISFLMSLSGAILSFFIMLLFKRINAFSIIGISILGSLFHIIGQIIIAIIFLNTISLLYYFPYMILLSIPTGFITGTFSDKLLKVDFIKNKFI